MSDRPRPLTAGNVGWKFEDLFAAAGSERDPHRLRVGIDDAVFTNLDSGYLVSPISSSSLRNAAPSSRPDPSITSRRPVFVRRLGLDKFTAPMRRPAPLFCAL